MAPRAGRVGVGLVVVRHRIFAIYEEYGVLVVFALDSFAEGYPIVA